MSADLFEAFGNPPQDLQTTSTERAANTVINPSPDIQISSQSENTWQPWPAAITNEPQLNNKQSSQGLWAVDETGADVLFDAGEFDSGFASTSNDEDFGDFEQVETEKQQNGTHKIETKLADTTLLDLDDFVVHPTRNAPNQSRTDTIAKSSSQALITDAHSQVGASRVTPGATGAALQSSRISSDDEWGAFEATTQDNENSGDEQTQGKDKSAPIIPSTNKGQLLSKRGKNVSQGSSILKAVKPAAAVDDDLEEDIWDEFEDDSPSASTLPALSVKTEATQELVNPQITSQTIERDRPTNIPPPAVLLTWMQNVFSKLASQARQSGTEQVTGDAALQAYRACARIIAGRAVRWKRDTILAQSMRIGAAGRSGGMKLTTLDKGESRKEDQAAEDAIATWTRVSYVLNAAMVKAKVQKPPMALSSKLIARLATGLDVLTANHACATCGLRRNERILGIDVDVSDIFGEFWVEHWGHKDCADTWYQFNGLLDQR